MKQRFTQVTVKSYDPVTDQEELKELKQQVKNYHEIIDKLKNANKTLQDQLLDQVKLKEENKYLKMQNQRKTEDLQQQQQEIQREKNEKSLLSNSKLYSDYEDILKQKAALETKVQDQQRIMRQMENENIRLDEDNKKLFQALEKLEKEVKPMQQQLQRQNEEIAKQKEQIIKSDYETKALKQKNELIGKSYDQDQGDLTQTKSEVRQLQQRVADLEKQIQEKNELQKKLDEENCRLNEDNINMLKDLQKLSADVNKDMLKELQECKKKLEVKEQSSQRMIEQENVERNNFIQNINELNNNIQILEQNNQNLQQENQSLRQELDYTQRAQSINAQQYNSEKMAQYDNQKNQLLEQIKQLQEQKKNEAIYFNEVIKELNLQRDELKAKAKENDRRLQMIIDEQKDQIEIQLQEIQGLRQINQNLQNQQLVNTKGKTDIHEAQNQNFTELKRLHEKLIQEFNLEKRRGDVTQMNFEKAMQSKLDQENEFQQVIRLKDQQIAQYQKELNLDQKYQNNHSICQNKITVLSKENQELKMQLLQKEDDLNNLQQKIQEQLEKQKDEIYKTVAEVSRIDAEKKYKELKYCSDAEIARLQRQLKILEEDKIMLQDRCKFLESELDRILLNLKSVTDEACEWKQKYYSIETYKDLISNFEENKKKLIEDEVNSRMQQIGQSYQDLEQKSQALRQQEFKIQTQAAQFKLELSDKDQKYEELMNQYSEAMYKIDQLNAEIENMKQYITQSNNEKQQLKNEILSLQKGVDDNVIDNKDKQQAIEKLKRDLQFSENNIQSLKKEKVELQRKLEDLISESMKKSVAHQDILQREIKQREQQREQALQESYNQIRDLKFKLEGAIAECQRIPNLEKNIDTLKREKDQVEKQLADLKKNMYSGQNPEVNFWKQQSEQLQQKYDTDRRLMESDIQKLVAQIQQLQQVQTGGQQQKMSDNEIWKMQNQNKSLIEEVHALQDDINGYRKKLEDLNKANLFNQNEAQRLSNVLIKLEKENQDLKNNLQKNQQNYNFNPNEMNKNLLLKYDALDIQNKDLLEKVKSLQIQLDAQSSSSGQKNQIDQLKAELILLANEKKQLNQENLMLNEQLHKIQSQKNWQDGLTSKIGDQNGVNTNAAQALQQIEMAKLNRENTNLRQDIQKLQMENTQLKMQLEKFMGKQDKNDKQQIQPSSLYNSRAQVLAPNLANSQLENNNNLNLQYNNKPNYNQQQIPQQIMNQPPIGQFNQQNPPSNHSSQVLNKSQMSVNNGMGQQKNQYNDNSQFGLNQNFDHSRNGSFKDYPQNYNQ